MSGATVHRARVVFWIILTIILIALPAGGIPRDQGKPGSEFLSRVSGGVAVRYWAQHPEEAPARLAAGLAASESSARTFSDEEGGAGGDVFNADVFGVPQNEESITACRTSPNIVLGGTNDWRFIVDPEGDGAGWHFSNNGGRSLTNEGLLPAVTGSGGETLPTCCDPVDVAGTTNVAGTDPGCGYLYASALAFNLDPFGDPSGIALYRSTPEILATCDTSSDLSNPACWPTRRLVAEAEPPHFLDKEWFDVGVSSAPGEVEEEVVWVAYADFTFDAEAPLGFSNAEIFAVRCDRDLVTCTDPIPISEDDGDVQFADVTIAPDGRVYVSWTEIVCELDPLLDPDCSEGQFPQQTFIHKVRVAEPGSTDFGPERIVYIEEKPIPFGGFLHANDFRVATYPKNDVAMVDGDPRIFVVWDACGFLPDPFICEEPLIKLRWSDNFGVTWQPPEPLVLSKGGDNYFPSIVSNDASKEPTLAFTWFTNRFDRAFHNRQDVEFMTMDPDRPRVRGVRRLTRPSNESEADPILGGFFIGDYIEVFATGNRAWVHYNANYLHKTLFGPFGAEGIPIPQQDNFLARLRLGNGD
jgi:hypothetical protein